MADIFRQNCRKTDILPASWGGVGFAILLLHPADRASPGSPSGSSPKSADPW